MFNLILFGPPGSGKGTQSDKIVEKYGLVHLSTGNLLRQEIKEKSPLGLEAKKFIDKGQLVPDEVVIGMVDSYFDQHKNAKGFLFDGFPRTVAQAKALDRLMEFKKKEISQVLILKVNEEELIKRLVLRGKTSGRSDDADENIQRNRQAVYKMETLPVADYYSKSNKVVVVDGMGEIQDIFERLSSHIDKKIK
ncbi:MAG: adenylate kinase [Chitinophagaceae bacterium]|nr:adenylate kinase [Chitinophagaceae bacterium]MBL0130931.1 adenylate kinase [Chitinophagaceae bacterium]